MYFQESNPQVQYYIKLTNHNTDYWNPEHSKYHAWVLYQNRIIKKGPIPDVPYITHC